MSPRLESRLESGDADRPLAALERGDWRGAYALVAALSRGPRRDDSSQGAADLLACVRMIARSMLMHTHGQVAESWSALAQAAGSCRPAQPGITQLTPASPAALFVLPTPTANRHWGRLALIGRREEEMIRSQRDRLLKAMHTADLDARDHREPLKAQQLALIEAVIDHLSWVEWDPFTWQAPVACEKIPPSLDLTRGGIGDLGRNYLLRRATVLYQSVFPREGGIGRTVWDQMGGYRQVRGRALGELNERGPDVEPVGVPYRIGYARTLQDAALWSKCMRDAKMG